MNGAVAPAIAEERIDKSIISDEEIISRAAVAGVQGVASMNVIVAAVAEELIVAALAVR
jgi:hypothetical protein